MGALDELEAGYQAESAQAGPAAAMGSPGGPSIPTASPAPSMGAGSMLDALESQYQQDVPVSDLGAIRNSAVRGFGSFPALIDELLPFNPNTKSGFDYPHLFGLGGSKRPPGFGFADDYNSVMTETGMNAPARPATEYGKVAENVAENAAAAAPFGPLAMLLSGIFGGGGGYLGEKAGGPTGRAFGSFFGGVSPSLTKLKVVKEIGETLGPTLSKLPLLNRVIGNSPIEAAVGRALEKTASNAPEVRAALAEKNMIYGPETELDALKMTDEVTKDVGLARATDTVESALPQSGFKQIAEKRAAVREKNVVGTEPKFDPNTTDYALSKGLEEELSKGVDNYVTNVEDPLWERVPKDLRLVADETVGTLKGALNEITYGGTVPLAGDAKGIVAIVENAKEANGGILTMGQIQEFRKRALQLGRSAADDMSAEGRQARLTASAVEEHLRDLVDENAKLGLMPQVSVDAWKEARTATNLRFKKLSPAQEGTKGLERVGLLGKDLDNTAMLNEGLRSPDKLASHLKAAEELGGPETLENVKSLYRQALLSNLTGKAQSKWGDIIGENKDIWSQVFTEKQLAKIGENTDDALKWVQQYSARTVTGGPQTGARLGNTKDILFGEKGLAAISQGTSSFATLAAGTAGAKAGWDSGESIPGKLAKGVLGGLLGATVGTSLKKSAGRASASFDELLIEALKNPRVAERVLKAAEPSELSRLLGQAAFDSLKVSALRGGSSALNSLTKSVLGKPKGGGSVTMDSGEKPKTEQVIPEATATPGGVTPEKAKLISMIDSDPIDSAIFEMESARGTQLDNPDSTATGPFQLVAKTARNLGVKDPNDWEQNYEGYKKLRKENEERFKTSDPATVYAAHFLGAPLLDKWRKGKDLDKTEQEQVDFFRTVLRPRFLKIYADVISRKAGSVEA